MARDVGDFVVAGSCLLTVKDGQRASPAMLGHLRGTARISPYRTVEQDPAFGVRQIIDVALRALSPGNNDTTTAVMSIDYLGTILAALAPRRFSSPYRWAAGKLRLITVQLNFSALVRAAFDQIRRIAGGPSPGGCSPSSSIFWRSLAGVPSRRQGIARPSDTASGKCAAPWQTGCGQRTEGRSRLGVMTPRN